ncbi:unnamed protein product [Ectocarpus sp. CCAP 1310/34]|nr:unnamed protein product [Ectocarpus sp. CCAP 1310/34]
MTLSFVKSLAKISDNIHIVAVLLAQECSCTNFTSIYVKHEVFGKVRETLHRCFAE